MKHSRTEPVLALLRAGLAQSTAAAAPSGSPPSLQGWPGSVSAPGSALFGESAKEWLFCLGPGRWRFIPVLHRRPVLLARMVRFHLEGNMASSALNSRTARDALEHLDLECEDVAEIIDLSEREYDQLQALVLQVRLVERELQRRCRRTRRSNPWHT